MPDADPSDRPETAAADGPAEPDLAAGGADPGLGDPDLVAYRIFHTAPELVPAEDGRAWMDETPNRFAHRCTPMKVANGTGWELLCPDDFSATWTGGQGKDAITITAADPARQGHVDAAVQSHFGNAILTFQTGYLFRTAPGWALWVRGAPNHPTSNIQPLEGIVETDWLPLTFTVNWRFSYPGTVRFHKGDRFAFLTPVAHAVLSAVQPRIRRLEDDPELKASFEKWSTSRTQFNAGLEAREPDAVRQGWQKHYHRGDARGGPAPLFHVARRRMKWPRDETGDPPGT